MISSLHHEKYITKWHREITVTTDWLAASEQSRSGEARMNEFPKTSASASIFSLYFFSRFRTTTRALWTMFLSHAASDRWQHLALKQINNNNGNHHTTKSALAKCGKQIAARQTFPRFSFRGNCEEMKDFDQQALSDCFSSARSEREEKRRFEFTILLLIKISARRNGSLYMAAKVNIEANINSLRANCAFSWSININAFSASERGRERMMFNIYTSHFALFRFIRFCLPHFERVHADWIRSRSVLTSSIRRRWVALCGLCKPQNWKEIASNTRRNRNGIEFMIVNQIFRSRARGKIGWRKSSRLISSKMRSKQTSNCMNAFDNILCKFPTIY